VDHRPGRRTIAEWLAQPHPMSWPDHIYRRARLVISLTCFAFVAIEVTGMIGVGRTNPVWVTLGIITIVGTLLGGIVILICPWPSFRNFAIIAVAADISLGVATFYPTDPVYALFTSVALTLPGGIICAELDRTAMRAHSCWVGAVLALHAVFALSAAAGWQERTLIASFILSTGAVLFGTFAMQLSLRDVLIETARLHAHNAVHDQLTQMLNRRGLWEQMPQLVQGAAPSDRIVVALLDLDEFKQINDAHGHEVGDAVLVSVARSVIACSPRGALVARVGGEEFAVIAVLPQDRRVSAIASDLLESVRDNDAPAYATASVGIASESVAVLQAGAGVNGLLSKADVAMYKAKRAGGDRYVVATTQDSKPVPKRPRKLRPVPADR